MTDKQERVEDNTKNDYRVDLNVVKNTRECLNRLRGRRYHWDGYVREYLDMLQAEVQTNLDRFGKKSRGTNTTDGHQTNL